MTRFFRLIAVFAVLLSFVVSQVGQVNAQSNALAIQPRKDYNLKPGESVADTLTVTNRNPEQTLNLKITIVDFDAANESGTPRLLRNIQERKPWSLKNFVDMPQQVTLDPNETARIPITVSVPKGTGAGSYYSAIEYAAVNAENQEQVNISASGVSLMFVTVPGQTKEQMTLLQFGAFVPDASGQDGAFQGLYFSNRPRVLSYRLRNDGNVAEQPTGSIIVKNSSGKTVYEVKDANPKKQLALRGQVRRFDACINPEEVTQTTESGQDVNSVTCGDTESLAPGRYTAELTLVYGENGNETREITAKATFWYLPWWFIGVIVAGLLILAGFIFYIVRRVQNVRSRKTRRR